MNARLQEKPLDWASDGQGIYGPDVSQLDVSSLPFTQATSSDNRLQDSLRGRKRQWDEPQLHSEIILYRQPC